MFNLYLVEYNLGLSIVKIEKIYFYLDKKEIHYTLYRLVKVAEQEISDILVKFEILLLTRAMPPLPESSKYVHS